MVKTPKSKLVRNPDFAYFLYYLIGNTMIAVSCALSPSTVSPFAALNKNGNAALQSVKSNVGKSLKTLVIA